MTERTGGYLGPHFALLFQRMADVTLIVTYKAPLPPAVPRSRPKNVPSRLLSGSKTLHNLWRDGPKSGGNHIVVPRQCQTWLSSNIGYSFVQCWNEHTTEYHWTILAIDLEAHASQLNTDPVQWAEPDILNKASHDSRQSCIALDRS